MKTGRILCTTEWSDNSVVAESEVQAEREESNLQTSTLAFDDVCICVPGHMNAPMGGRVVTLSHKCWTPSFKTHQHIYPGSRVQEFAKHFTHKSSTGLFELQVNKGVERPEGSRADAGQRTAWWSPGAAVCLLFKR